MSSRPASYIRGVGGKRVPERVRQSHQLDSALRKSASMLASGSSDRVEESEVPSGMAPLGNQRRRNSAGDARGPAEQLKDDRSAGGDGGNVDGKSGGGGGTRGGPAALSNGVPHEGQGQNSAAAVKDEGAITRPPQFDLGRESSFETPATMASGSAAAAAGGGAGNFPRHTKLRSMRHHVRGDTAEWRSSDGESTGHVPVLDSPAGLAPKAALSACNFGSQEPDNPAYSAAEEEGAKELLLKGGAGGVSSSGGDGPPGSVQQIVLKFTTVSEGSETPSFVVARRGARIGRGADNDICIPNDACMRTQDHAAIVWQKDAFHLVDRGHPYGAAVRIGVGLGLRDWPLPRYAAFSAGNTVCFVSGFDEEGAMLLEVHSGPLKGERRRVSTEGATVGRATENSISIADRELSRHHSKVEWLWDDDDGAGAGNSSSDRRSGVCRGGGFYLCDVGSTNGTYMQLVGPYAGRRRLCLSDHILVGRTGFSVNRFDWGVYEDRGMRRTMEDKSLVVQDLGVPRLAALGLAPQTFVAVYDGHGGAEASAYLWQHLHLNLAAALDRAVETFAEAIAEDERRGVGRTAASAEAPAGEDGAATAAEATEGDAPTGLDEAVREVVSRCYRDTDEQFLASAEAPQCGSTATTMLILGRRLYSFNVGDSRTVLCRRGRAHLVSRDHKPAREDEAERIKEAGGLVINKRVMGELAVSRAFGDREFKMGIQAILNEGGGGGGGTADTTSSGEPSGGGGSSDGLGGRSMGGNADSGSGGADSGAGDSGIADAQNGSSSGSVGEEQSEEAVDTAGRSGAVAEAGGTGGSSSGSDSSGGGRLGGSSRRDEQLDKPLITAEPEMLCATLCSDDDFALLACDGLFDVFSSDEAIEMARAEMLRHGDAQRTCEVLIERAITERYTRDNVSTVLVVLNPPSGWWRPPTA